MNKIIWALVLLSIFSACSKKSAAPPSAPVAASQAEPKLEQIVRGGRLRVGLSTFVPWAMVDKNDQLIGFEVDVARQLAEDIGVELELVPTEWSGIIPALLNHKFDIIIGGMSVTPQRNLQVNFSDAYAYTGMALAASSRWRETKPRLADFNSDQLTLAVRSGATSLDAAKLYLPQAKIVRFDNEAQLFQAVVNGQADGLISAIPTPNFTAIERPDDFYIPVGGEQFTKEGSAFAVVKGEHDFLNFLNNWIANRWNSGFLEQRSDYWFKSKDWESLLQ